MKRAGCPGSRGVAAGAQWASLRVQAECLAPVVVSSGTGPHSTSARAGLRPYRPARSTSPAVRCMRNASTVAPSPTIASPTNATV